MDDKRTSKRFIFENHLTVLSRDRPNVYEDFANVRSMQHDKTQLHNRFEFTDSYCLFLTALLYPIYWRDGIIPKNWMSKKKKIGKTRVT
jgi:hypothetical protein